MIDVTRTERKSTKGLRDGRGKTGYGFRAKSLALVLAVAAFAVPAFPEAQGPAPGTTEAAGAASAVAATQARSTTLGGLVFSGSLLGDAAALFTAPEAGSALSSSDFSYSGSNRFTLNFITANHSAAKAEGSLRATVLTGSAAAEAASSSAASVSTSSSVLVPELRKLYVAFYTDAADFSVGRQIVSFGRGRVFSPIDSFSSVSLEGLEPERTGSDTLRVKVPLGDLAGIDAVAAPEAELGNGTYALRAQTTVADTGLSAVGMYRGSADEYVAGADFKGDLEVGLYGEGLVHVARTTGDLRVEAMAGTDYSIANEYFFTAEYQYRGRGEGSERAAVPRDDHDLFLEASWEPTSLETFSANLVWDVTAMAALTTAAASFSVAQNATLAFYVRLLDGALLGLASSRRVMIGTQVEVKF
jgi:hypothetical protein